MWLHSPVYSCWNLGGGPHGECAVGALVGFAQPIFWGFSGFSGVGGLRLVMAKTAGYDSFCLFMRLSARGLKADTLGRDGGRE